MPLDRNQTTYKTNTPELDMKDPESSGDLATYRPDDVNKSIYRSDKEQTDDALRNTTLDAKTQETIADHMRRMLDKLDSLHDDDYDDDDYDERNALTNTDKFNPDNLPKNSTSDIATQESDELRIMPKFHAVKNLPGYQQRGIRRLGLSIFSQFTSCPVGDILVLANFGGSGPNSMAELNSVSQWIKDNGVKIDESMLDFSELMPDYSANSMIFQVGDNIFQLIEDFAGKYIYSWPAETSKLAVQ